MEGEEKICSYPTGFPCQLHLGIPREFLLEVGAGTKHRLGGGRLEQKIFVID